MNAPSARTAAAATVPARLARGGIASVPALINRNGAWGGATRRPRRTRSGDGGGEAGRRREAGSQERRNRGGRGDAVRCRRIGRITGCCDQLGDATVNEGPRRRARGRPGADREDAE